MKRKVIKMVKRSKVEEVKAVKSQGSFEPKRGEPTTVQLCNAVVLKWMMKAGCK